MTLKVKSINISQMNKGAHWNYMETVVSCLDKFEAVKTKVQTEYSSLLSAMETEKKYFTVSKKSESTAEIEESDRLRDMHYSGFSGAVDYALLSSDATKVKYAQQLKQYIKDSGVKTKDQRDKQTGRMTNFLTGLRAKFATEIEALNLEEIVANMERENEAVKAHIEERAEEYGSRTKGALKSARADTDDAYRKLVEKVNALIVIEGEEVYVDFVKMLNAEIERYKREVLNQPSKKDDEEEDDDRPVTGEETPGGEEENPDGGEDKPDGEGGDTEPDYPYVDDGNEDRPPVQ